MILAFYLISTLESLSTTRASWSSNIATVATCITVLCQEASVICHSSIVSAVFLHPGVVYYRAKPASTRVTRDYFSRCCAACTSNNSKNTIVLYQNTSYNTSSIPIIKTIVVIHVRAHCITYVALHIS